MVDLITLGVVALIVLVVFLHKTSSGVAVIALLAGVLLDQLLSGWIISLLPDQANSLGIYLPVIVHLLLTFIPVVATLVAVKVQSHHAILSLLTSLVLGLLVVFFGLKVLEPLPLVSSSAKNSGLFTLLNPFQKTILASGAILALVEMVMSHRRKGVLDKKKRKK